jgi:hypothetical protein
VSRYEQRKARRKAAEETRQRLRAEAKERARLERERLEGERREEEKAAARDRPRVAAHALMVSPPKFSDLLRPPAPPDPSSFEAAAETRRREVARQLAELARLGLDKLDKPDRPPDT